MKNEIRVDLVIPVYKPDEKFKKLITGLRKQTWPLNKIIIVNTEKQYFPEELVTGFENIIIRHIEKSEFDHGGTRNLAASLSESEIIVFMTQDAVPADEYLIENLTRPIRMQLQNEIAAVQNNFSGSESTVGICYGRQLAENDCRFIEAYTRSFNYPEQSRIKTAADLEELGIKTFFASNVCSAYRREVFDAVGGFVIRTIFNEDMIFAGNAIKQGYAIAYQADAKVIHSHNYSNFQQLHRNFDLAVSQKNHPEVFAGIKSESEGIRLVKNTATYLLKSGKGFLIPQLVISSGFKYVGYWLGFRYQKLPRSLVLWLTMNKSYWRINDADNN